jgi:FkbH-like protein
VDDRRYRLSRFAVVVPFGGDRVFAAHAIYGRPTWCDGASGRVLLALGSASLTVDELEEALSGDALFEDAPTTRLPELLEGACARGIVVTCSPDDELEDAYTWIEREHGGVDAGLRRQLRDGFAPATPLRDHPAIAAHRRVVVLGWCTAEALAPVLEHEAAARGLELAIRTGFEDDAELVRSHAADYAVLWSSNFRVLGPLFTLGESSDPLPACIAHLERLIRDAAAHARRALLVLGCVAPQTAALGLVEPESSLVDRIVDLNRAIRRVVGQLDRVIYIDLERHFARAGKAGMLDDAVAPYAHAGVLASRTNREAYGLVANACLDAIEAVEGTRAIRCVAVDLDGVLWPGEIAEPEFSFAAEPRASSLLYGVHGGIHEALRALRARGILLAVVSKNVRDSTLRSWREQMARELGSPPHLLLPEDFVALEIEWIDKSRALRSLARELGVAPSAIAFVDDSPLERAEVAREVPEVWVIDEPLERLRELLLTSPRFEVLERSREASVRTEATQARLARDREAATSPDRADFLAGLDVRCALAEAKEGAELARVAELVRRTNQFRTTPERPSLSQLRALCTTEGSGVLTLAVADRFGDYGIVGAALVDGGVLRLLTLSCRVIGVDVHAVLFRAALQRCRAHVGGGEVLVRFEDSAHNAPTRRLFEGGDWIQDVDGFRLRPDAPLPAEPQHCRVARSPSTG